MVTIHHFKRICNSLPSPPSTSSPNDSTCRFRAVPNDFDDDPLFFNFVSALFLASFDSSCKTVVHN